MDVHLTIVVMAHGRPRSLDRLLESVSKADITAPVDLVVSVDPGSRSQADVETVARSRPWVHGAMRVQVADGPLGLTRHFMACGDLTAELGPIVLLEDDLEVGPGFLAFASSTLGRYQSDPAIGGITLSSMWFNGFTHLPFVPVLDDGDVFFAQIPWYHGMVWTSRWWEAWRDWMSTSSADREAVARRLHRAYARLGADEWFPDMAGFVHDRALSFVFPRVSHAINHGEPGVHFDQPSAWFQAPLATRGTGLHFVEFGEARARYDSWLELEPEVFRREADGLPEDVIVDLNGQRPMVELGTSPVITTRLVNDPAREWGVERQPLEENVLRGQSGRGISLASADVVRTDRMSERASRHLRRCQSAHQQPEGVGRQLLDRLAARWRRG